MQNQAATQLVLINKLQTDTKQRVVLYDALTSSLKTAQQQDVAHRINEIGVKTDQEAQTAMAAIGAATNDKMADMLEAAAAYAVCIEGRSQFTRSQLMRRLAACLGGRAVDREEGLRSFGSLLRTGRVEKLNRGNYTLAAASPYLAEARRFA